MATRRRRKEDLRRLNHWLEGKRLENKSLSHDEAVEKQNRHELMKEERQNKRKLKKLNKFQRLLKWRKRRKKRLKQKLPDINHRKDKMFGKTKNKEGEENGKEKS